jgi:pyrroloquinoline-quinone synthase
MPHGAIVRDIDFEIQKFDLLSHPFYRAWSAGELTREDLRGYATRYYPQIAAFPTYLSVFHSELPDNEMRRVVLRNLCEEEIMGACHSELWLDFAEGMGADRHTVQSQSPIPSVQWLINTFRDLMLEASTAFAALYAYESQVPRIAREKARGLREFYGANDKTCQYFDIHITADAQHARVWAQQLEIIVSHDSHGAETATKAANVVSRVLWKTLDRMEEQRHKTPRKLT